MDRPVPRHQYFGEGMAPDADQMGHWVRGLGTGRRHSVGRQARLADLRMGVRTQNQHVVLLPQESSRRDMLQTMFEYDLADGEVVGTWLVACEGGQAVRLGNEHGTLDP